MDEQQQRTDERFMAQALDLARQAARQGEIPVGCVIVADGVIVGRGYNLTEQLQDVTAHAEIQAITAAEQTLGGKYLPTSTLYVTLEPCIMCAGAIGHAHIARLVYAAADPKKGYTHYAPQALHPKCQVATGIMEAEAQQMLKKFFQGKR